MHVLGYEPAIVIRKQCEYGTSVSFGILQAALLGSFKCAQQRLMEVCCSNMTQMSDYLSIPLATNFI